MRIDMTVEALAWSSLILSLFALFIAGVAVGRTLWQ